MSTRVFTGIKPTGALQLGNYLGAVRPLLDLAADPANQVLVCVADLHALTVDHSPDRLRARTFELAATLLACGLDPRAGLFVQSSVPAHTELCYLLESTAAVGEMTRMIQFKEKGDGQESSRLSLLTYPALMAADILAHRAEVVPVGDDQRQHLELAVTLARRFNNRYGPVFTVPRGMNAPAAERVKDLRRPTMKMGKSGADGAGVVFLLDPPDVIAGKVRRAVTDGDPSLRLDPDARPGVTNLATILAALAGEPVDRTIAGLRGAAELKGLVTEALVATLTPIRQRCAELLDDPAELHAVLRAGRDAAMASAAPTVAAAGAAIGLLPLTEPHDQHQVA